MKRKRKTDEEVSSKDLTYCCTKTSLKSILRDSQHQLRFEDVVIRCNTIVTEAYQFIRLYCLHAYSMGKDLPTLDQRFIEYCIKTVGKRDSRGKKAVNTELQQELQHFYEEHFVSVLDHKEKHDLCNLTYNIPYLATQMHTAIHNNLKEHFVTRLLRFINLTTTEYENQSKEEIKVHRRKLKDALFDNDASIVPPQYTEWYKLHRHHILPDSWKVSLPYDVKANPSTYLQHSFYMNGFLEKRGFRLFQPLSLRTSIVPHYMTFDTASLISILADKGEKGKLLQQLSCVQERFWDRFFNLDKRVFHKKRYKFNYMIQTDGVAVSICFVHKDHDPKKRTSPCESISTGKNASIPYVNELSDDALSKLSTRNVVGCDPGKYSMVYMSDGTSKLRYNAFQRRTESLAKRNGKILQTEKIKHGIHVFESVLSDKNSKTVDIERFKAYLLAKNKLNTQVRPFYEGSLHRKLKWRQFVYGRKSEDRFLNKMSDAFGSDAVIAYGDWSRTSQMKHFMPTKGVGMRNLISKRFSTVSVNEFRTSKLCCNCFGSLQHLCVENEEKKKKVFRCLICPECESSESKQPAFVTRDLNSALNIRQLALTWMTEKTRPVAFCRKTNATGLTRTSSGEKTGQSVDFAARNGADLCESESGLKSRRL